MSVDERHDIYVELRCPIGPKALLGKILQQGEKPKMTDGNLMELNCRDCARTARQYKPEIKRVLHRYNIIGELVESVYQED
jgi:hypothetical protein